MKPSEKTKILVVDDERDICELTRQFLAKRGFDVSVAMTGDEAIAQVKSFRPALIILDVSLGDANGLDVLKEVRSFDKEVKIVMLTAHDDPKTIRESMLLGATDYLAKPFNTGFLEEFLLQKLSGLSPRQKKE